MAKIGSADRTEPIEIDGFIDVKEALSTDDILREILLQLKIMNFHLGELTGNETEEIDLVNGEM